MNVKEYFKTIDKMIEDDRNAACCDMVKAILDTEGLTEKAMDLLMDKLEGTLVGGTYVFASVTEEENGSANFHYVTDANEGKWIYVLLNAEDMNNIREKELFSKVNFLNLIDLLIAADNNCGIELIASADKSITASPDYIKDLADRIVRD